MPPERERVNVKLIAIFILIGFVSTYAEADSLDHEAEYNFSCSSGDKLLLGKALPSRGRWIIPIVNVANNLTPFVIVSGGGKYYEAMVVKQSDYLHDRFIGHMNIQPQSDIEFFINGCLYSYEEYVDE